MAKGRMLHKKISNSKRVNDLPVEAALLYTWLISHLDYNGVFYGSAQMIKSLVFPRRECSVKQVENWLRAMETAKNDDGMTLVKRFKVNEELFLWMPGFKGEQPGLRAEREASDFPNPPQMDKTSQNNDTNDGNLREKDGNNTEKQRQIVGVIPEKDGEKSAQGQGQVQGEIQEELEEEKETSSCCSENDKLSSQEIAEVAKAFEENVCKLTSGIAVELNEALQYYSKQELLDAIKACALQNKHTMAYFLGVLRNKNGAHCDNGPPKYKVDPDKYIKGKYGHMVQR